MLDVNRSKMVGSRAPDAGLVIDPGIMALRCMSPKSRGWPVVLEVLLWALSAMLIMVFLRAGWDKFDSSSGWARAFTFWGYPAWFRLLIGALGDRGSADALLAAVPRPMARRLSSS